MLQSLTGKWWEKCKWGWTLEKTFWTGVVAKGEVLSITKKKLTRNPPIRLHKYIHIYIHGPASLGTPPLPPPHGYGSV